MHYIKTPLNFKQNSALSHDGIAQAATNSIATRRLALCVSALALALLAACGSKPMPQHTPPAPVVVQPAPPVVVPAPVVVQPEPLALPAVRSWEEYRRRAARLIMEANPGTVDHGKLPEQLYGIPVVQVQLNADGSVRLVDFMRQSKVGPETNDMAVRAIGRVLSFGPVTNLPQPWQFNETFLYNDRLKFQLRTVVERL